MDTVEEKKGMNGWQKLIVFLSIIVVLVCGGIYYSRFIATTGLTVKEYTIKNSNIPDSFHGAKIIHISDLHYKTTYYKKEVEKMVKKINELKPDLVVLTGDLFDKDTKYSSQDFEELTKELLKIEPTIGKYAISGNHDMQVPEWETVIKNSGFTNLNDTFDTIYMNSLNPLLIVGASSSLNNMKDINDRLKPANDYIKSIAGQEKKNNIPNYKILLLHEPDYIEDIDYQQFDLVLAGHSHNGQVRMPGIGAIILPEGAKKYYEQHYTLNQTDLYISSGLGTSTIPYRLFNKPAINLYRLTNK